MDKLGVGVHHVTVRDAWMDRSNPSNPRLVLALADSSGVKTYVDCYFGSTGALRWTKRCLAVLGWDGLVPLRKMVTDKTFQGRKASIRIADRTFTAADGTERTRTQVVKVWAREEPEPDDPQQRLSESEQGDLADALDTALKTGVPAKPSKEDVGWDEVEGEDETDAVEDMLRD